MKNADKSVVLGLLDGKQFQEKVDVILGGIKKNSLVIAKKYGELLVSARKDFDVAEKTLVAKIVTSVYNETKEIRKRIKKDGVTLKDTPAKIRISIRKWKEFKTYSKMVSPAGYEILIEETLNESLKKYHLDGMEYKWHPGYFGGKSDSCIEYEVTKEKSIFEPWM